ncbi:hypothetical protein JK628_06005 [Shewanella sp. KX20019]|uniref:hypothetical protein n=1 Tax=Shewanella sp. KX20019 TaxID=2803864 RepID=UPI0019260FD9|nr:hypothetical protein [Shewanella sp. KX20019]QQX81416.1 hypothetical protein JK628_06005 [Shewanella sp. KX20019]
MKSPKDEADKKFSVRDNLILLVIALVFAGLAFLNIIDGYALGRNGRYYLSEEPVMFYIVVAPKIIISFMCFYYAVKNHLKFRV